MGILDLDSDSDSDSDLDSDLDLSCFMDLGLGKALRSKWILSAGLGFLFWFICYLLRFGLVRFGQGIDMGTDMGIDTGMDTGMGWLAMALHGGFFLRGVSLLDLDCGENLGILGNPLGSWREIL